MEQEAISTSLMAGIIGLAIVFVFMCLVYLLPGLASSLALVIYTGLILVILNAFDITLTLTGYCGYHPWYWYGGRCECYHLRPCERRDEQQAESVHASLKSGFQKAMSAIVDGNITTLIAAAVLWLKGTGSVKGFAQTLALGIVVSMFTALVITSTDHLCILCSQASAVRNVYGQTSKERKPFDFLGKRKVFFIRFRISRIAWQDLL